MAGCVWRGQPGCRLVLNATHSPGMENNAEVVANSLQIINGMLADSSYLAGSAVSLADISAYEELGQNQAKYANCVDYSSYPDICRWLLSMENLPYHAEAHAIWNSIGDLNKFSGGMGGIAAANKQAAAIFTQTVKAFKK